MGVLNVINLQGLIICFGRNHLIWYLLTILPSKTGMLALVEDCGYSMVSRRELWCVIPYPGVLVLSPSL